MSLYDLPKFEMPKWKPSKIRMPKFFRNKVFWLVLLIIFISSLFGFLAGMVSGGYFYLEIKNYLSKLNIEIPKVQTIIEKEYIPQTIQEEAIIKAVEAVSPAVVSIIVTKDVPIIEEYYYNPFEGFEEFFDQPLQFQIPQYRQKGTEKREVGGGTGFIVSEDGLIVTNKHVVLEENVDYTVFTNDGRKFPVETLTRDPIQDLAIIKIKDEKQFPAVKLGDSSNLQIGQTVIAIGNALGEFRNTVSTGVISGLGRTITASGGGLIETIEDVIQTDAAINKGNSGGPLLNSKGEVIGINTATVLEAQSIGFAIPINKVKKDIEQVKSLGKIVYPFLGVRYIPITETIKKENDLPIDYGVWVVRGNNDEPAIYPGSAAEKAGLKENDIILKFGGEKITVENSLAKIIIKHNPGDNIILEILRNGEKKNILATLEERSE